MAKRAVTYDDLLFAAEWVGSYEADHGDPNRERIARLVTWLEAEAAEALDDERVTLIAREYKCTRTVARRALKRSQR
jgi:hypothetical protein